ncbi:MAG: hypothetical protein EB072_08540 [Betaproteobacteria bacterium]|nr:hypothetical protein [Betaproteobacteria bacterium]
MSETMNDVTHDVTSDPPMMIVPANPRANVSIMRDGRHIAGPTRPVFSFEYDALQFSMNVRSYVHAGVEVAMNEAQIAEVLHFLNHLDVSEAQSRRYAQSRQLIDYLASTDWYVIRALETGVPVPQDVTEARARAREAIQWS